MLTTPAVSHPVPCSSSTYSSPQAPRRRGHTFPNFLLCARSWRSPKASSYGGQSSTGVCGIGKVKHGDRPPQAQWEIGHPKPSQGPATPSPARTGHPKLSGRPATPSPARTGHPKPSRRPATPGLLARTSSLRASCPSPRGRPNRQRSSRSCQERLCARQRPLPRDLRSNVPSFLLHHLSININCPGAGNVLPSKESSCRWGPGVRVGGEETVGAASRAVGRPSPPLGRHGQQGKPGP